MFDFNITFDFSWINNLGTKPLYVIMWHFLINGGWILFLVAFIYGGWLLFVNYKQTKFGDKQSYVFLAVDIPRENYQTPKAVENIFTTIAGAHMPLEWWEKAFKGEYQLGFSFEIVSIDGYIQYIIRTPIQYRNLVEASIYSQYADAEITEVEDYTKDVTVKFPSDEYNLWGTDLVLVRPDYYPIKTYIEFQEMLDNEFKDPMAAFLEILSKIGKGEQIWFQILISPANNDWQHAGIAAVDKIMGISKPAKQNLLDKIADAPLNAITKVGEEIFRGLGGEAVDAKKDKKDEFNIMKLSPQQKREVDAILRKIDKINYNCKVRYLYFGKREVFKKGLGVSGTMGAIKQYNSVGLNGFKPDKNKTIAKIYLTKLRLAWQQNKFLANYKSRNPDTCHGTYSLSVEELATLYHFPHLDIKNSMVKKIEAKKSQAPVGLPIEEALPYEQEDVEVEETVVPIIDYDNKYFENKFAVDKTGVSDKLRKERIIKEIQKEDAVNQKIDTEPNASRLDDEPIDISKEVDLPENDDESQSPTNLPFI